MIIDKNVIFDEKAILINDLFQNEVISFIMIINVYVYIFIIVIHEVVTVMM